MRLATYNIEWFSNLFDDDNALAADDEPSGRHGVSRAAQIEAVAKVLVAVDADAVMIIEAHLVVVVAMIPVQVRSYIDAWA